MRVVGVTGVQTCALPIWRGSCLAGASPGVLASCLPASEVAPVKLGDQRPREEGHALLGGPDHRQLRQDLDRKSVVSGKSVDLGGRRLIKKNTTKYVSLVT